MDFIFTRSGQLFSVFVSVHVWHFRPDDRLSRQRSHWSIPSRYIFSFNVYNLLIVVSGFEPRPSVCGFFCRATTNSKALMTGWSLSTGLISLAYHSEASGFIYFFPSSSCTHFVRKEKLLKKERYCRKRRSQSVGRIRKSVVLLCLFYVTKQENEILTTISFFFLT